MKKNNILFANILLVMLSILFLPGCSLFDKIDDISFDSKLTETLDVVDNSTGQNVAYSEIIVIHATTDSEINKYLDKIKGFSLNKLTYQVVGNSSQQQGITFSGSFSYSAIASSSTTVLATITNLNLDDLSTVHNLPISQSDIKAINNLLKNDKAIKFYLEGFVSETPVSVLVEITLDVTVEADAL